MRAGLRTRLAVFLPALLGSAAAPVPSAGQGWTADAGVGLATYRVPAGSVDAFGAQLGVRHGGPRWFFLSGGVPIGGDGVPWAAAGAGAHLPLAGTGEPGPRVEVGVGVDGAVHGFGYADRVRGTSGAGGVVEVLPALHGAVGGARLTVRSGLMHYARGGADTAFARTVHHSDARAGLGSGALAAYVDGRLVRDGDVVHPFAGGGVEARMGAADVWAHAGRWLNDDGDLGWGAGARVSPLARIDLFAAVRRDARDPLYGEPTRTSWTVGVSRALGRVPARAAAPPTPAPRVAGGETTFRLPLAHAAAAPAVAGDFTGWQPVPMRRGGEGWELTLRVPSGVHRYAFRAADGTWFVPPGTPGRRDDGMGGSTAVLVVP